MNHAPKCLFWVTLPVPSPDKGGGLDIELAIPPHITVCSFICLQNVSSSVYSDNNIDCTFLTETWLNTDGPATLNKASPPNYSFSYSCRTGKKKGGGPASILSASLAFKLTTLDVYVTQVTNPEYASLWPNPKPVPTT